MDNLIYKIEQIPKGKSVFVFDLDGTLAESKTKIDLEMGELLARLTMKDKVAIIGGASFEQLKSQLPDSVSKNSNLFLLPLDGGSFYEFHSTGSGQAQNHEWREIYKHDLSLAQRKAIGEAFTRALGELGYVQPEKTYGVIVEDRGGQTTWSALGQEASLKEKEKWNKEENGLRLRIVSKLKEYLPDMEAKVSGLTSIDVTLKGIDKKFGIEQLIKYLNVSKTEVMFFGDAFELEANDYPALESGVTCYKVASVQETKNAIRHLLGQ